MPNINVSLDINALRDFIKENPSSVFKGKKDYFSLTLYANDVPDKFGNDFSVKPRLSKELKEEFKKADKKLPFIGNAKIQEAYDPSKYSKPTTPIKNAKVEVDDSLPF